MGEVRADAASQLSTGKRGPTFRRSWEKGGAQTKGAAEGKGGEALKDHVQEPAVKG
jgi:hypothetical protein